MNVPVANSATEVIMLPAQCRAARALLDWSQERLAQAAERGTNTVRHFEAGRQVPADETLKALRKALEKAGVEFVGEGEPSAAASAGVRLAKRPKRDRRK